MSLINYEVSLWSANCVITNKVHQEADPPGPHPVVTEISTTTNVTLDIIDTKLYRPVVTLLTEDYNKLLQQLRTGFKNCQME